MADQDVQTFSRTRLRPRVAVSSPHAERLGNVLLRESQSPLAGPSLPSPSAHQVPEPETAGELEIVHEGGGHISVYGSSCALVGETAYRHGILVHQLADQTGEVAAPAQPLTRADGRDARLLAEQTDREQGRAAKRGRLTRARGEVPPLPPRLRAVPVPGPTWPLRYELRRLVGVRTTWLLVAAALVSAIVTSCWLGHGGVADSARALVGWPSGWPLPPVAAVAGLLGALAFGQEYRYPALAPSQAPVPRRLGLLLAKLTVSATVAVALCAASTALNTATLLTLYGSTGQPSSELPVWLALLGTVLLAVGSAWAGLLAAAVFRSLLAGALSVLAVPLLVAPAVRELLAPPAAEALADMSERLSALLLVPLPFTADEWAEPMAQMLSQPLGGAMMLSLVGLFGVYVFGALRSGSR